MNKEIINALLERAEEMLDKNYSRKIGAEEIITILREYERLQKENKELKEDNQKQWEERCRLTFKLDDYISKDKIINKIREREHIIHNAKLKYGKDYEIYDDTIYARFDIRLLQELLEEE